VSRARFLYPLLLFLVITLFFAGRHAAWAVLMRPMSIEELTTKAEIVLHGKVVSKSVLRDTDGQIMTQIELDVTEAVKGGVKGPRFMIVQSGGVLGDEITTVSGQEHYEIGEEVVAFLVLNKRSEGVTLGLAQGKFHVEADPETKQPVARNPFHGKASKDGKSSLKLAELKQRVKGVRP
jgi:hypothetical protein